MKKTLLLSVVIGSLFGLFAYGQSQEPEYTPIFMERNVLESSIEYLDSQPYGNAGKIYVYGDYIFINEQYKGVHIVNNSDPTNPVKEGFLRIPGNIDIAIRNNFLFADNATDLVSIDISKLPETKIVERKRGIFEEPQSPNNNYHDLHRPSRNHLVIGWIKNN